MTKVEPNRASRHLSIAESKDEGGTTYTFTGSIDENADFSTVNITAAESATFDLAGVDRINSFGILKWSRFFGQLSKDAVIELARCPFIIIEPANAFYATFFGGHAVRFKSFHCQYYCQDCDILSEELIQATEIPADSYETAPPRSCRTCGKASAMAGEAEDNFRFLARSRREQLK